ncbi:ribonuclease P protein component [Candidatus Aerophobetes bacterium]|uniref:Ribonuclease P protein component n=1 Tax=Aerophobetes bacterium TaxID=2030807 RepID=A0A2A4X7R7_UNCAE|nr:MAG: ribonuclease P protein component [Candidatus Aerophobetes bacterium]
MESQEEKGTCSHSNLVSKKLTKSHKLLKSFEFRRVYKARQYHHSDGLAFAFIIPTNLPGPKLGITVKKKWGKAHDRNRFKRIVREAYRHVRPHIDTNIHIVVQPTEGFHLLSSTQVTKALEQWLQKQQLLD